MHIYERKSQREKIIKQYSKYLWRNWKTRITNLITLIDVPMDFSNLKRFRLHVFLECTKQTYKVSLLNTSFISFSLDSESIS